MHNLHLIQDLAIVMTVSAIIMLLCHRLRLPTVLGYILAGLVIGPHTPPYALITDLHNIHTLSELGVIFLLFSIGLEFSLTKLGKVGLVAFVAATLEILMMIWIGYSLGKAFGWNFINSLFLGAILSISSTTIIAKVLFEMKKVHEKFAQVILGILIIEDLLAIVIIAVLSGLASTGTMDIQTAGTDLIKVLCFVGGLLFFGFLLIPRFLRYAGKLQSPEIMVVSALGLCFAGSLLAAKFGFSIALGAFLMGAIIAETKHGKDIVHLIEPIRDMFTAVFFVSVGLMINPGILVEYAVPILIITAVTIVAKIIACSSATFLTGYSSDTSLKVGLGLAQIGEFSFIIAQLGESRQVTAPFLYPIAVAVSVITTLTTPFLMKNAGAIIELAHRIFPKPLGTFLGLYTSWIQKMSVDISPSSSENPAERKALLKNFSAYLPRLAVHIIAGFAVFYGANYAEEALDLSRETYWILLGALLFPVLISAAYTLDRVLWTLFFEARLKKHVAEEKSREIYRILHNLVRFAIILGVSVIALFIGSHFNHSGVFVGVIFAVVFLFGILLWDSVRKIHERIEKTVLSVFDQKADVPQKAKLAQEELIQLIQSEYPWETEMQDFLLPYVESAVNQTLRDLKLRGETGASIIAIYREDDCLPNPSPDTRLLPGDVLLLMGSPEQVRAGMVYLAKKMKEPPVFASKKEGTPQTRRFRVPTGAFYAGHAMRDLKVRRKTGATILGIQKGETVIQNPTPDVPVDERDTLVLFGWPDELEAAVRYLSKINPAA